MNISAITKILQPSSGEQIIKVIKQPSSRLIKRIILPGLIIILDFFIFAFLLRSGFFGLLIFIGLLCWGIFWILNALVKWQGTMFIITDQRVVDVDRQKIFLKTVSDISLEKIQDVFYKTQGIAQTFSHSGSLYISILDSQSKILVPNVSSPQKIQQLILQLKNELLNKRLNAGKLSAEELIKLVDKIKEGIGEEKFQQIVNAKNKDKLDKEA